MAVFCYLLNIDLNGYKFEFFFNLILYLLLFFGSYSFRNDYLFSYCFFFQIWNFLCLLIFWLIEHFYDIINRLLIWLLVPLINFDLIELGCVSKNRCLFGWDCYFDFHSNVIKVDIPGYVFTTILIYESSILRNILLWAVWFCQDFFFKLLSGSTTWIQA